MNNSESCQTRIVSLLFILIMIGPSATSAVTNHGLTWGVEEGDRFDYTFSLSEPERIPGGLTVILDFYVIVNELDTVPDNVTDIRNITLNSWLSWNLTQYYSNGTLMDSTNFRLVEGYPIGNWGFIQELKTLELPWIIGFEEWEWIDTETEWGFAYNSTDPGGSRHSYKTEIYSKSDGILVRQSTEIHSYSQLESLRIIARKESNLECLPVLLAAVGLSVIVLVIYFKRR